MIDNVKFLNLPTKVGLIVVAAFLVMQLIGEILELKGKAVPEFVKLRKRFIRKRQERKMFHYIPLALDEMRGAIKQWAETVNRRLEQNDTCIKELAQKLDQNNQDTLSLLIDTKRGSIISFASLVIDENATVTREQFKRIFKVYEEYESIIKQSGLTNGEVDIAYRIITESYEKRMRNHSFVEDQRGY